MFYRLVDSETNKLNGGHIVSSISEMRRMSGERGGRGRVRSAVAVLGVEEGEDGDGKDDDRVVDVGDGWDV